MSSDNSRWYVVATTGNQMRGWETIKTGEGAPSSADLESWREECRDKMVVVGAAVVIIFFARISQ